MFRDCGIKEKIAGIEFAQARKGCSIQHAHPAAPHNQHLPLAQFLQHAVYMDRRQAAGFGKVSLRHWQLEFFPIAQADSAQLRFDLAEKMSKPLHCVEPAETEYPFAVHRRVEQSAEPQQLEAASLPLVALTVWQVLVERARLKAGQKILIHAGSGGVGTIAIQLAKHLGATVATTISAANADLVRSLGADVVIDYRTQDFSAMLSGYDVVLNSLDAKTLEASPKVLKPGGELISISGPPDPTFARAQGLNALLRLVLRLMSAGIRRKARRVGVDCSFLFMRADGGQLGEIATLIEDGTIRPVVDRTFPFGKLNEAMTYVDRGRAKGKVVVSLKGGGGS